MPHFTLPISPQGPILDAAVMLGTARDQALRDSGQQPPAPVRVRALIDTGAAITGVTQSVLSALGLMPTGRARIHTPSTGGTALAIDTYDTRMAIFASRPGDLHFISGTIQVAETDLTAQDIGILIGTDLLKSCTLL